MRAKKYRFIFLLALICSIALATGGIASADDTLIVKPSTPNGWFFGSESGATAVGTFVTGPDTPPLGLGSFFMMTPASADGYAGATTQFNGIPLSVLTKLEYSTYRTAGGPAPLIALQFNIDYDGTDADESWQRRLIFEPYHASNPAAPANDTWQTWNAFDGLWWGNGVPGSDLCPQSSPCLWSQVLTHWPNARIHATLGAVILKAGSSWTGFEGNADALTIGVNGTNTTFDFEPETACTTTCYVNGTTGNDAFGGDSPASAKKTIQAAVNAVAVGGEVIIAAGTYNEQVSVNKNGLTITGAGPTDTLLVSPVACTGNTVGIKLLGSHTGTTLTGLSVSGYDIGLHVGENIGFTVTDLSITNVNASNNCIHGIWSQAGTTNGVLIDDITASNNGTFANFGRGVWMINGAKSDVTISNSTFNNNGLVGIDLSDGDVTGANITGNTVSGNGDSGIGVLGPEGPDANFVTNNTVTNNGRFGIEIKNPSGTTTVSGNTVSLTVLPAHLLDYAGIGVFRRSPGAANADQPSGVSVTGNTVSGYTNPNAGEGFGIVVEGTGMTVTNNTVSANDIGIQVQEKNPSINTNGTDFFDRGNASAVAAVLVNNNNITNNVTFGVRAVGTTTITNAKLNWWNAVSGPGPVGPGTGDKVSANVDFCPWLDGPFDSGGSVVELVKNLDTSELFCTIQSAIDDGDTSPGDTIQVAAGTFVEQVDDHKGVILVGAGAGSTFIKAPASIPVAANAASYVVRFTSGGSSEISGFTITGPGPSGCGSIRGGLFVRDGSFANIHDNTITAIRDSSFSGCQNGVAIEVGRSALPTTGTATIKNNLIEDFQKNGITVSGAGSSATIEGNTINGAGPTTIIAQNGIQFSSGATGSATDNTLTGFSYTPFSVVSTGFLLFDAANVVIDNNDINEGQAGIYQYLGSATIKNNTIKSTSAGTGSAGFWGIIVSEGTGDVSGNEITSDGSSGGVGLGVYDGANVTELLATKNLISNWQVGVEIDGTNFNSVNINRNSITSNGDGMSNYDTFLVDGTCNWWGAADGPSGFGPGSGDTVSDNVTFLPWLLSDDLNGPCIGGQKGKLIVKKDVQKPIVHNDDFEFTVSGGYTVIAPFKLDDDFNGTLPNSKGFTVTPASYTITETPAPGWYMTSVTCVAKNGDVAYTPNLETHSVSVSVGNEQEITCTFVNKKGSTIAAFKYNDKKQNGEFNLLHGDAAMGGWEFTLFTADGTSVVAGPTTTDNGGLDKGTAFFNDLKAGSYLLCETDDRVPATWTNSQPATIFDPPNAPCYQVNIDYHDLVIKSFGNYEVIKADLEVTKVESQDPVVLGEDNIVYTITVKNNGPSTAKDVTLVDTLPANVTFVSSVPGAPTCDYDDGADTVTCDLGDLGSGNTAGVVITVTPTETGEVTNTATATSKTDDPNLDNNTEDETTTVILPTPTTGTIIVKKTLEPDGPTEFPFEVRKDDILLPADDGEFDLGDDGMKTLDNLVPGTYNINEVAFEIGFGSGFIFGGASCDNGVSIPAGNVYNLDVTVAAGQTIICEFTNYENSNIIIAKETIPDGDDEKFHFTSSHPALDGNEISDGQSFNFTEFVPGTYTVTETEETGWTLTDITCEGVPAEDLDIDEANRTVDITVGYGDTVECTFTNTKDPEPTTGIITIVKNWSSPVDLSFPALEDEPQFGFGLGLIAAPATTFDLPEAPAGLNGSASKDFELPAGEYRLYESPESGWEMIQSGITNHEAVCTLEGDNGTLVDYNLSASLDIDLKAGDHITCTYTNELVTYDFTITKALVDGAAVPGSDWDFNIYLSNSYETDADDEFAESFTLPAAGGSKTYVVPTAYWKVAETVQAGYDLTLVTCEPGGENIPNPSNDDVDILVIGDNNCTFFNDEAEPEPTPNLTISKTDGQTSVVGETDLTYTITVKNIGLQTATAVTLTDTLPIGVKFLSGSTDTGTCAFPAADTIINAGNKTFTCDLGDLAPDATAIITVTVDTPAVIEAKELKNEACADAENADKVCANDITTVTPPGAVCANGGDWRKDLKHNQSKLFGPGEIADAELVVPPGYYIGQVKNINKTGQNCTYLVGLASYGKFDEVIDNQILTAWDWPRYVGPNETIFLRVPVPECAQQIDLFYGDILWSLDGQRYGNRLLDWHHVLGNQYCAAIRGKKITEPAGDPQSFDFSIPQLGENFSLADGGVSEWYVYNPANYGLVQVNEAFVDGWTVDNGAGKSACKTQTNDFANYLFQAPLNPGDPTGFDVTALAGQKITCKFVNVKDAKLTIVKKVITSEAENTQEFPFEISGDGGLISEPKVADGGSHSETLPAGTYTVKETAFENGFESGYVYGKVECTNGASSDTVSVDVTLQPGDDVTCTFVNKRKASVTIYKDAETIKPADDTTFVFTGDFPSPFPGPLGDGDFAQFFELTQKSYTVTETIPDDWALDQIECVTFVGDNPYPNYSVDLANGELTLDIKWGDNVKCTFYNVQYRLEIQKQSDPEYDANVYFDSLTLPDANDANPGKFTTNGNGGIHAYFIKPGVYDITELVPDGYVLAEVTCNDPEQATPTITDDTVTIDLTAGNVTCVFHNEGRGSIQVIKDVVGDNDEDPQDFTYFINKLFDDQGDPDNQDIADFSLDDDSGDNTLSNTSEVYEVEVGTYIVGETELDGWTVLMDCRDQDNNVPASFAQVGDQPYVQFKVELGKNIVCTFTNRYAAPTTGTLIIKKELTPDGATEFPFRVSKDGSAITDGEFSLGDGGEKKFEDIPAGTYNIDETGFSEGAFGSGFIFGGATCDDDAATTLPAGNVYDLDVTVAAGDTITCTFVNYENANITIWKVTDPADAQETFTFTSPDPKLNGEIGNGGFIQFTEFHPGTYDVTETAEDGWTLDDIVCVDANDNPFVNAVRDGNTIKITVDYGETAECTFYNSQDEVEVPGCAKNNPERKDCSSMSVEDAYCEAGVAYFEVKNTGDPGDGDVNPAYPLEYRIYVDDVLVVIDTISNFPGGTTITIEYAGGGSEIRFEIDQQIGHPGGSNPNGKVENCFPLEAKVTPNTPPTAKISGELTQTLTCEQTEVTFNLDGSGSSDAEGAINYNWSTGSTNPSISVTYGQGSYPVSLTVTDEGGLTDTDDVTLTVNGAQNCAPPNTPPTANDGGASGDEDTPINGQATGSDPESNPLTYSLVGGTSNGGLTFNPDGSFSYTPNANFNGGDSFTFKVNDGTVDSNVATINISVNAVNDGPTNVQAQANVNQADLTCDQTTAEITLTGSADDSDGPGLTFTWDIFDTSDVLLDTENGQQVVYAFSAGTFKVVLTASDGSLTASATSFNVTINPAQACEVEE